MINRLAKFNDLIPSSLPFVEGRLEGHRERKNYTIIGRGVAEDSKQSVKIQSLHGYNLGAVSAMPKNGSGLHSHTTAEVFVIYSGKWRFYWGADGKNEIILNQGDIISMPTNMFRGFENAGKEQGLIFVVLGNHLFKPNFFSQYMDDHIFYMAEDLGLCTYEKHHKQNCAQRKQNLVITF